MAFMAKILSWRFRHLNIVGCLLKRRSTKGGSRVPQDPTSHAPKEPAVQSFRIHGFQWNVRSRPQIIPFSCSLPFSFSTA